MVGVTSGLPVSQLNYFNVKYLPSSSPPPESTGDGRAAVLRPQATCQARPEAAATVSLGGEKLDLTWISSHSYFMTYII